MGNVEGESLKVQDLKYWGVNGPYYDYFEQGKLDIFVGNSPCIDLPICRMILVSDGSGSKSGWYVDYVVVSSFGPQKAFYSVTFRFARWLASSEPPFSLTALIEQCDVDAPSKQGKAGPLF